MKADLKRRDRGPDVSVPEHAHPLVKDLYMHIVSERINIEALGAASGVSASAIRHWRSSRIPRLEEFVAVANTLGFDLCIRRAAIREATE